jgi:acetyl-CoA carboxylase carboxyltransferase component
MRRLQLEYGAEIGRAVVNFEGPILFYVIGRYHGGAYVVFSKVLNDGLQAVALEGSYASVIGGAPAAAVVFPREVRGRTLADPRVLAARRAIETAAPGERRRLRDAYEATFESVRAEKLGELAREFDATHSVHRAKQVGSLDDVIAPNLLRLHICRSLAATRT